MLSASCRQEIAPNVMRNVLVLDVAEKPVHGRISYRMRANGEEGEKPTGLPTTCRHLKVVESSSSRAIVSTPPPFAVGKVRTSLNQTSVAASPREKTKTILSKVRAGRIFANRFEFDLKPNPVDSIREL
jgi:hypothetical protein